MKSGTVRSPPLSKKASLELQVTPSGSGKLASQFCKLIFAVNKTRSYYLAALRRCTWILISRDTTGKVYFASRCKYRYYYQCEGFANCWVGKGTVIGLSYYGFRIASICFHEGQSKDFHD